MRTKKIMSVTIEIHYTGASRAYQKGQFQLRGRKPEQIALDFWRQIQKDMSYHAIFEKVICNNEDITQLVNDLEKEERKKKDDIADESLPF